MNSPRVFRWKPRGLEFVSVLAVMSSVSSRCSAVQTCCLGMCPRVYAGVWWFCFFVFLIFRQR